MFDIPFFLVKRDVDVKRKKKVDNRKYFFMKIIITDLIFVLQKNITA